MDLKLVGLGCPSFAAFKYISSRFLVSAWTGKSNKHMAPLVHNKAANFTLESLFAKSPNKILTVAAEGRLLEKARHKLVVFDFEDIFLS